MELKKAEHMVDTHEPDLMIYAVEGEGGGRRVVED